MSDRPNILFILTDDQGPWAMGCAGNRELQTPNLDRLAADGIRFDNFFCTSPVCSPARASWISGLYPHATGQFSNYGPGHAGKPGAAMNSDCVTLGEIFKQAGYRCGHVGCWHMGDDEIPQHGFTDYWVTYRYCRKNDRFVEYLLAHDERVRREPAVALRGVPMPR